MQEEREKRYKKSGGDGHLEKESREKEALEEEKSGSPGRGAEAWGKVDFPRVRLIVALGSGLESVLVVVALLLALDLPSLCLPLHSSPPPPSLPPLHLP